MIKYFFTCLFIAALTINAAAQDIAKQNAAAAQFIKATKDSLHLPGLAVGIVKNGRVLQILTYGEANLDWQIPVDTHTNFQIASCSKLLATTLMLKSIYNHKIALDDDISKYIDSIPKAWQGLKVRHLLTHSSGIKIFKQDKNAALHTVINALKDSVLQFPYGTKQAYASGDFTVLLYLFEKVYKKSYPEIIKDEITRPLHMTDGAFDKERTVSDWIETDIVPHKATTYYQPSGNIVPYKFMYPQYTYTAGGYFASLSDLTSWAVGLDKQVLFPANVEHEFAYKSEVINNSPSGFSQIGWGISTTNGIVVGGHSGGPGLADVQRFPKYGLTVIVLTNDGEMLPYFANAVATFYIDNLPFKREVTKFKRVVALQ